jgi:hypothetical protein
MENDRTGCRPSPARRTVIDSWPFRSPMRNCVTTRIRLHNDRQADHRGTTPRLIQASVYPANATRHAWPHHRTLAAQNPARTAQSLQITPDCDGPLNTTTTRVFTQSRRLEPKALVFCLSSHCFRQPQNKTPARGGRFAWERFDLSCCCANAARQSQSGRKPTATAPS